MGKAEEEVMKPIANADPQASAPKAPKAPTPEAPKAPKPEAPKAPKPEAPKAPKPLVVKEPIPQAPVPQHQAVENVPEISHVDDRISLDLDQKHILIQVPGDHSETAKIRAVKPLIHAWAYPELKIDLKSIEVQESPRSVQLTGNEWKDPRVLWILPVIGGLSYMIYQGYFRQAWNYVYTSVKNFIMPMDTKKLQSMGETQLDKLRQNTGNHAMLKAAGVLKKRGWKDPRYLVPTLVGPGLLAAAGGAAYAYRNKSLRAADKKQKREEKMAAL